MGPPFLHTHWLIKTWLFIICQKLISIWGSLYSHIWLSCQDLPLSVSFYNYSCVCQVCNYRPICLYWTLLLMIQLTLFTMMFCVICEVLEIMIKLIFIKFDSSNKSISMCSSPENFQLSLNFMFYLYILCC